MEMFETDKTSSEFHPCQYCSKLCRGKQCRDCHFEMLEDKQGKCFDCNRQFIAVRKDGSIRKRCNECQMYYNAKHIAICPSCSEPYHAYLEDGRVFDKCYKCYQNSISKCQNCDKFAFNGYSLCKQCYQQGKVINETEEGLNSNNIINRQKYSFDDIISGILPCKRLDCSNLTNSTFCKMCHTEFKIAK